MRIRVLSTPELGNRSYVVSDGAVSVVIDPQRDLDRLDDLLEHDVSHVLETHVHNDYVTGGHELARRTGAAYGVNAADDVAFERLPLTDGQQLRAGTLVDLRPGHPRPHPHPPLLRRARPGRPGRAGRAVQRRLPALRHRGPHRPDRAGAHARARGRAARVGPPPRRPGRGRRALPDPRVRVLLRRRWRLGRGGVDDRGRATAQPRARDHLGRRVRRPAGRLVHRLPGLLRAHVRPQPHRAGRDRPRGAAAPGAGPRGRPTDRLGRHRDRPPAGRRLRRRAPRGHDQRQPRQPVRDVRRLGRALGTPAGRPR